jgi:hypothetical protein
MFELLYTATNGTFSKGHQKAIGLREFRIVQAIKHIVNANMKRAGRLARLSHAFFEYSETRPPHASQSRRSSGHCSLHRPEEDALFLPEA